MISATPPGRHGVTDTNSLGSVLRELSGQGAFSTGARTVETNNTVKDLGL